MINIFVNKSIQLFKKIQFFSSKLPIDINLFRVDKGADLNVIRQSLKARFRQTEIADRVSELD